MTLIVRAFPVRTNRAEVEQFVAEIGERAEEARRFFTGFSVRRESWFYQDAVHYPMVIGVTEVTDDVDKIAEEFAQTDEGFAAWFKQRVNELSGVDENKEPLGPPTEMVFDSSGAPLPAGVELSARIYPLRSREALDEFADELRSRARETHAFYEGFGVPREVWFAQETEYGPVCIGVTAMTAVERASDYAATDEPFAAWFKQRVMEVTGVDPNVTPLGPPSDQVFDFRA
jgi:hypothetical protein